jgi:Tol biopolymer transport system component
VVFAVGDPADVWLEDIARHVSTRLTFDPADDSYAVWSPDDSRIVFGSQRTGGGDIYSKSSSGTGSDELLFSSPLGKIPRSFSPDGRFLLINVLNPKTKYDLDVLTLPERKVVPFLDSEFDELMGDFSPDGRFVAYTSNESGRFEIYVVPYPGPGGKWQISTAGGAAPVWRRDGKELFYLAPDRKLMAVGIKTGAAFEAEAPQPLFETRIREDPDRHFDVSADGQRFLLDSPLGDDSTPPITLVQNWTVLLRPGK